MCTLKKFIAPVPRTRTLLHPSIANGTIQAQSPTGVRTSGEVLCVCMRCDRWQFCLKQAYQTVNVAPTSHLYVSGICVRLGYPFFQTLLPCSFLKGVLGSHNAYSEWRIADPNLEYQQGARTGGDEGEPQTLPHLATSPQHIHFALLIITLGCSRLTLGLRSLSRRKNS